MELRLRWELEMVEDVCDGGRKKDESKMRERGIFMYLSPPAKSAAVSRYQRRNRDGQLAAAVAPGDKVPQFPPSDNI
ncbi:hypothetical protein Dda_0627 [Drechslerella dactyloides]|uniref:Uncharacterized protein n=1 Tax=Drechslerella dactyloides TaxID=74499 RepID=A0AAD6J811_DREDA|nr:hypothetical protein Dda_0627 [Drechslerella dactyloides]